MYNFLATAGAKYGVGFWKPGSGIIHQVKCVCLQSLDVQWVFYFRVERELKYQPLENFTSLGKQLDLLEAGKVSYLLPLSYLDNSGFFLKVILVKL